MFCTNCHKIDITTGYCTVLLFVLVCIPGTSRGHVHSFVHGSLPYMHILCVITAVCM